MMCQSVAVSDACCVEQKGVEEVLIYVSSFIIYKQTYTHNVNKSELLLYYYNHVFYVF